MSLYQKLKILNLEDSLLSFGFDLYAYSEQIITAMFNDQDSQVKAFILSTGRSEKLANALVAELRYIMDH